MQGLLPSKCPGTRKLSWNSTLPFGADSSILQAPIRFQISSTHLQGQFCPNSVMHSEFHCDGLVDAYSATTYEQCGQSPRRVTATMFTSRRFMWKRLLTRRVEVKRVKPRNADPAQMENLLKWKTLPAVPMGRGGCENHRVTNQVPHHSLTRRIKRGWVLLAGLPPLRKVPDGCFALPRARAPEQNS